MIEPARFGVEEEFLLVDEETFAPLPRIEEILPLAQATAGDLAQHEMHEAQIEIATEPCTSLDALRRQLVDLREKMAVAAKLRGARLIASGTYPGKVHYGGRRITETDRYEQMAESFGELARDQLICGCHVHVEISDPDIAIAAMNRSRRWLAVILAIGTNSPYCEGRDTGYESFRTEVWSRWPTAGPPGEFRSRAEYDELLDRLVSSNVVVDRAMAYWDVRPSMRFPTLEFRMCDVMLTVDHAVLIAALIRALATTSVAEVGVVAEPVLRSEWLRAARWRAARSGITGELIDPIDGSRHSAHDMIDQLLDHVSDALISSGDSSIVDALLHRVRTEGTGAAMQRQLLSRSRSIENLLHELASLTLRI